MEKSLGEKAEAFAEKYLVGQGMRLIERNFRSKMGEIDLIMLDESAHSQSLVFVEVRYRKNSCFGGAAASVDKKKQQKIIKTAQYYLAWHRQYAEVDCRFDVISIQSDQELMWIKNAFNA